MASEGLIPENSILEVKSKGFGLHNIRGMESKGWIKVHRSIANHWVWSSPKYFQQWMDILFLAAWEDCVVMFAGKKISLKRGKFVTTIRILQRRWRTNAKTVLAFLDTLEMDGMIIAEKKSAGTIISVCNYDKYQCAINIVSEVVSEAENHSAPKRERKRIGQRKGQQIKEDKNINNKINNSLSLSRESSEKIFEEVKGNDKFWEDCCRSLSLEKAEVESLLNAFFSAKVDTDEFPDSYSKFKNYFLNWARNQINSNSNGTKQKPGATAEDKYANRRGVEPSAVKEKNFKSGF